jgi:hypothetical protein
MEYVLLLRMCIYTIHIYIYIYIYIFGYPPPMTYLSLFLTAISYGKHCSSCRGRVVAGASWW